MVQLDLKLPDSLARETQAAGLLTPQAIEQLLREEIRRRRVDQLFEATDRLAALDVPPLTEAEIQAVREAKRVYMPTYQFTVVIAPYKERFHAYVPRPCPVATLLEIHSTGPAPISPRRSSSASKACNKVENLSPPNTNPCSSLAYRCRRLYER